MSIVAATVLVVDDNPDMCELVVALLRTAGHQAAAARGGKAALAHLRSDPTVGLLLLDWMMPDMNGQDVLRAVRSDPDPRLARLPVLVYSALSGRSEQDLARRLGAQGWVVKAEAEWPAVQAMIERHLGAPPAPSSAAA